MQGLELCPPPLCAGEDLPPAQDLPHSPPTPPVPCHHNKESESSSGQEGIRADTSINMGPQVPCTALPTGSSPSLPVLHSSSKLVIYIYIYI